MLAIHDIGFNIESNSFEIKLYFLLAFLFNLAINSFVLKFCDFDVCM